MSSFRRKKLVQEYYSARANQYDRQKSRTWKTSEGFGKDILKEILDGFREFNEKTILEIGVGTGRNAKPLLEKIEPCFIGLDLSKKMIQAAKKKLLGHKKNVNLILGDADHLPFASDSFGGVLCMSTMHYFFDQEKALEDFRKLLKKKGILIYGDLSPHEFDNDEFFESLERTISKVHVRYYKTSEMKRMIEKSGFHVVRVRIIEYQKTYDALIEDKGSYFDVRIDSLRRFTEGASTKAKKQYALTETAMNLFYSVIRAMKE